MRYLSFWRALQGKTAHRKRKSPRSDVLQKAVIETLEERRLLSATIYSNDFSAGTDGHWSKQNLSSTPTGNNQFLGQFGGGNNAFLNGGYTWVTGQSGSGSAVQLSSSGSGYISVGPDDTMQFGGSITVSVWVKFTSTPTTSMIVDDVPTSGQGGFRLGVSGGKLYFEIHDASGTVYSNQGTGGGTSLTSGSWYQVVGTFDSTAGTINTFVNATLDRSASVSGTMGASLAQTFLIGRQRSPGTNFLNGAVDDFQVFDRALGAPEIAELPGSVSNGLEAYLKFDEGSGSKASDSANAAGVKLNLDNLGTHTQLTVSFDLYVIETWDGRAGGNYGPDIWSLTEDGNSLLYTTFANGNTAGQSYPGNYPNANHPKQTGASAINTLGYMNGNTPSDSTYHLTYTFNHTASSVTLNFLGIGLENLSDESWGLDNVVVTSNGTPGPSGLTATPDQSNPSSSINLSWNAASGAAGYKIYCSDDDVNFDQIGDTTNTFWSDSGENDGTKYFYEVSDYTSSSSESAPSSPVSTTTAINAPTNPAATPLDDGSVEVTWNDDSASEDGYKVQWWTDDPADANSLTTGPHVSEANVAPLTPGTVYHFNVEAFNSVVAPATSDDVSATPLNPVTSGTYQASFRFGVDNEAAVPGYITDIGNDYHEGSSGYTFGWVDPSTDEPLQNSGDTFGNVNAGDNLLDSGIFTMDDSGQSYSWEAQVPNGRYFVKLVAGDSAYTLGTYDYGVEDQPDFLKGDASTDNQWVTATGIVTVTDGKLTIYNGAKATRHALAYIEITDESALNQTSISAPTDVGATAGTSTSVDVRWTDTSDNEALFEVERATSPDGPWTALTSSSNAPAANAGMFADTTAAAGATYYYRVTATNGSEASDGSVSNAITLPASADQFAYNSSQTPWSTDQTIQAEDFDGGGDQVAYNDLYAGNAGGYYRSSDTDIGYNIPANRYFVGWTRVGEWMEYTVNVPTTGQYQLNASVASQGQGGTFEIYANGTDQSASIVIPDTGSFLTYQTTSSDAFTLNAGVNVLRIKAVDDGISNHYLGDMDSLEVASVQAQTSMALHATPVSDKQIDLSFTTSDPTVTDYQIYRSDPRWGWVEVTEVPINETYHDQDLQPDTEYDYQARGVISGGDSYTDYVQASATTHSTDEPTQPYQGWYFNDFEADNSVGPEWSAQARDVTPLGNRHFLGQFDNDTVTLSLDDLPTHSSVTVSFDFYAIRSWDGSSLDYGPDIFAFDINGGTDILRHTFYNGDEGYFADPYGNDPLVIDHSLGANEVNTLGYWYVGKQRDAVYHISVTIPDSSDSINLHFKGDPNDAGIGDESWGIDNVRVEDGSDNSGWTFGAEGQVTEGSTTASVGFDRPGGLPTGYTYGYSFGSNNTDYTITDSPSALIPADLVADGPSTVTANGELIDPNGVVTQTFTTSIAVGNLPPTATIDTQTASPVVGQSLQFTSDVTDPSQVDTDYGFTYLWSVVKDGQPYSLPDGTDVTDSTLSFTPTDGGQYQAQLYVWDKDGDRSQLATQTVSVAEYEPPTVTISVDQISIPEQDTARAVFTVTRTGDLSQPLDVPLAFLGNATDGRSDSANGDYLVYEGSGGTDPMTSNTITIDAGQSEALFSLVPINDDVDEFGGETASVAIVDNSAYTVGDPSYATVIIDDDDGPVDQPVTATAQSTTLVNVSWQASATDATYYVFRLASATASPDEDDLVAVTQDSSYVDGFALTGTTSFYRIYAQTDDNFYEVGQAQVDVPTTDGDLEPLDGGDGFATPDATGTMTPSATPSNLQATGINDLEILLQWQNNAANASQFVIQISTDQQTWTNVGLVPATATTYIVRGCGANGTAFLQPHTPYYFRVAAQNSKQTSGWSNIASDETKTISSNNMIVIVGGNHQTEQWLEQSWSNKAGHSVGTIWKDLADKGYNVFITADPWDGGAIESDGSGRIYDEIMEEAQRGYTNIGLIGYSHGGGVTANISDRLFNDPANQPIPSLYTANVQFTGTIDAVAYGTHTGVLDFFTLTTSPGAEWGLPSEGEINYWEPVGYKGLAGSSWLLGLGWMVTVYGASLPGAQNHELVGDDHSTIAYDPAAITGEENGIIARFDELPE